MATVRLSDKPEWIDDSRYECVNGVLRERPVPGIEHATMQQVCVDSLRPVAKRLGARVLSEWSIGEGHGTWLTPDVMFAMPGFRLAENGHLRPPPPPHLVIEIASPGQSNLVSKALEYRPYQIPYYWIIDSPSRSCFEVLMRERYVSAVLKDDELTAGDIRLPLADLWGAYDAAL